MAAAVQSIPSHTGPPGTSRPAPPSSSSVPPSPTLYIANLPSSSTLRKADLRTSLYALFSTYGRVLDVNAMAGAKMRGQAHVVFRDTATATQAMRALQGFEFFGRELRIGYAKGRSKVFERLEGVYRGGDEEKRQQDQAAAAAAADSKFTAPAPGAVAADKTQGPGLQAKGMEELKGTKRAREEEDEEEKEEEKASMEEGSDEEDVEMEESDEDD